MNQPVFWAVLTTLAILGPAVRLLARRPLWPARSEALRPWELTVAGLSIALLVFHCAAMFFVTWVDQVPFLAEPASAVRALGAQSQALYWIPAVTLIAATRRVWWPALSLLLVTLLGVGATMFWPFALTTHLAWIAAAVAVLVLISSALVRVRNADPSVA